MVWLVLDAAVDHWAGPPGDSALDRAIDEVAAVAIRHGRAGDRVGLAVVGTRTLCFERPERGVTHAAHLIEKLVQVTGCMDADRSGLDETELAVRVIEHMRPLDPVLAAHVHGSELDRIARRAEKLRARSRSRRRDSSADAARAFAPLSASSASLTRARRSRAGPRGLESVRLMERLRHQAPGQA